MVTQSTTSSFRFPNVPRLVRDWWHYNPILTSLTIAMVVTTLLGFIGIALDPRLVTNAPVWAKTTKFAISVTLYAATFLWMLPLVTSRPRLAKWVGNGIGLILYFEMALIILQAIRGQAMHFNYSTVLDGTLFGIMSVTIVMLWVVSMVGAFLLIRQKMANPALAWGIRLGAVVMVIGMGLGFLMTSPTSDQMAVLQSGQPSDFIGAHTVGAPDGGDGLPLLGWSTTHGDLRIAHFVGLHAFQIIPLVGWWLGERRETWLKDTHRVALVWVSAGSYLGITLLAAWQALRGQPLIAPDALTIGALVILLLSAVLISGAVLGMARRQVPIAG
jgi:hypothetical protein